MYSQKKKKRIDFNFQKLSERTISNNICKAVASSWPYIWNISLHRHPGRGGIY